ncbi:DUF3983 domain-containing protein [Bacillus thuringiensis]|nr:DUF3983 domain-containing protein [Bacillus thuringiensis]MDO6634178.1 DUF3983 domain-containing protein [Bacillus thuringiensis]MDO6663407.1 DUF3983 domain-containing protein [Bacillus thuringiensis]MDO6704348.1 DUF3983 domain-containing protein [Bacillus thuringiensis]
MANLKKKKIKKAIDQRARAMDKERVTNAWRNIFVRAGIVK